jgi:hypothetical protein
MNIKEKFMASALSTERGSGGIEMIICSFMILVFLMAPLMCFLFEMYTYGIYSLKWTSATENALDSLEWQLETKALSETERIIVQDKAKSSLQAYYKKIENKQAGEEWQIEICEFSKAQPPTLELQLQVMYEPTTVVGLLLSKSGKLHFGINCVREFPSDR